MADRDPEHQPGRTGSPLAACAAGGVAGAAASAPAPSPSPCAAMIFARFWRSASTWRPMARVMLSGSLMSFSSTTVISMPRSSAWTSRISRMFSLIVPVSDSVQQACGARRRHAAWSGDLVDRGGDVHDRQHRDDLGDPIGTD
jgi:hypothetical protein